MSLEVVVPILLSCLVGILGWMATALHDIAKSLAVVVHRVDNHETRLKELEAISPPY